MEEIFILEMPLHVEQWQADLLNKRYEYLRKLYNYVQSKLLKQYEYFIQMNEYKACTGACKTPLFEFFKTHSFHFRGINNSQGLPLPITFSKMGICGYVCQLAKKNIGDNTTYKDVGINTCVLKHMGEHIWAAWDKMIFNKKTNRISFKKYGEMNILGAIKSGGYTCGFDIDLKNFILTFNLNGKQGKNGKYIHLPILPNVKHTDYETEALKGGYNSIRVLTIVRKLIRGKYKYYLQITIKGKKPQKNRTLGKGNVGIDIGPSTIAISCDSKVDVSQLADKCENIQHKLAVINRKLDRSRRATNPDNFNENGTCKPINRKNGERRTWYYSNRYKKLKAIRQELQRKQAAIRKLQHTEYVNTLLPLGNTFIVEKNPYCGWAKRSEGIRYDKNGKICSNKRYGHSIGIHAPSTLITLLENKVKSLGGKMFKVDIRNAATGYDFTNGQYTKHDISDRKITLSNGDVHHRDIMAAFNLKHLNYNSKELKDYNIPEMYQDYDNFCTLEKDFFKNHNLQYENR